MKQILEDDVGKKTLLMGNVAIVRGAIEAGVSLASTYPGTPASEIGDTFATLVSRFGWPGYFEYSTNEAVALEAAAGASFAGVRAICSMKHVGANVAADPLFSLAYTGIDGGLVVITADDPSCWSSQNEQDNRHYAVHAGLPMLEPSSSQDALEMTRIAFEISEKTREPVLLRTTTRIAHTYGNVVFGPIQDRKAPNFERRISRVMVPSNARPAHLRLLENLELARELSENSEFNKTLMKDSELGIITSGISYAYALDAIKWLDLNASILKLGMTYPFPKKMIAEFIENADKVLVVEELDPWLETHVRAIAQVNSLNTPIFGKEQGLLPLAFELSTKQVASALAKISGKTLPVDYNAANEEFETAKELLVSRSPQLCAGCPHRASFYAIKQATKGQEVYVGNDIGCYALGIAPPFHLGDWLVCMGASIGIACGTAQVVDNPVIAVIGDSTFFHAGVPALINAVQNNARFTLVILDNLTTAMTGHQPSPGSKLGDFRGTAIKIDELVKGCGIQKIYKTDPYKLKETIQIFEDAINQDGPSVVIARHVCALQLDRIKRKKGIKIIPSRVDPEKCEGCRTCIDEFSCVAFVWDTTKNQMRIEEVLCDGCGVCINVCPCGAIYKEVAK
ncbi:MAG: indolepyruvate ferredoxin oxidoreductase subunit alpha [Promethearchaeota archaeon]